MGTHTHRAHAPESVRMGILTVSTTRKLSDDRSGNWIDENARRLGFGVLFHRVVTDAADRIREAVLEAVDRLPVDAILVNGGTGLTALDVTIEAVTPLFDKELTAFGPLFAQLSFQEIGAAAALSRATAGTIGNTVVFCLPGSPNACRLACEALIFPELGHLVGHIRG
jgi:molybdenum cofactor biosynthesis protein B